MFSTPPDFSQYADVVSCFEGQEVVPKGIRVRCLFSERHRNGDRNKSAGLFIADDGTLQAKCHGCGSKTTEFVERVGLGWSAWLPGRKEWRPKVMGRCVAKYEYKDLDGKLLAVKERIEPGYNGAKKRFRWNRPVPETERSKLGIPAGEPAWAWSLSAGKYKRAEDAAGWCYTPAAVSELDLPSCDPGLYRLPELLAEAFEKPVCIVEGEKDCDNLRSLGFVAVSPPHGSNAWNGEYAQHFASRRVVVFADNDTPGICHANCIVGGLVYAGAASVKLISPGAAWPIPIGGDVSQWLSTLPADKAARRAAVIELTKKFTSYTAKAAA